MEFPYIAAQVTAALYYKACNNIAKQTVKTEQSKENTSAKSTLQVCNQQLETQQYKQDFFAFSNSKQDEAPSESKHETSISLPFIKSLDDKKLFLECPYYEVQADPSKDVIRIPLEVLPRMGMLKSELLLFTNGRKTMVFDLGSRRYYSGCKDGKYQEMTPPCFSDEESTLEVDLNMPVMKSAEVYSTKSGTVYLIGGELFALKLCTSCKLLFYWPNFKSIQLNKILIYQSKLVPDIEFMGAKYFCVYKRKENLQLFS